MLTSVMAVPVPSGHLPSATDPPSSPEWHIYVVDSVGEHGYGSSLAIDDNGFPHLSYSDWNNRSLKYARWTGSEWSRETVDAAPDVGRHSSLALDSGNFPHISYDGPNQTLKYAGWDGSSWNIQTVDSTGHGGAGSSLALDDDDNPHISYGYEDDVLDCDGVKYAMWNGTAWSIHAVYCFLVFVSGTSMALDSHDYPHIAYSVQDFYGHDVKYARWNGTAWSNETVDAAYDVGMWPSLALDMNDTPHVSYRDWTNGDLKYATWNGTAWSNETVESAGDVGWWPSLALDSSGNPHISHNDGTDFDLKYVWWNGSAWEPETVDYEGDVGHNPSLAIDSDDLPHISYYDKTNDDLKYATKGELGPPSRSISLDIDPDTLNLKSEGRWVTAYVSAENASVFDIDVSSILLQDALPPERWDYQDDILMLKFNRQDLIAMLEVGESVEIKLSGKWKDGLAFEAYDYIRVIEPGRLIDFP